MGYGELRIMGTLPSALFAPGPRRKAVISAPETAQSAHDEEYRTFRQRRSDPRHGPGSMSLLLSSLLGVDEVPAEWELPGHHDRAEEHDHLDPEAEQGRPDQGQREPFARHLDLLDQPGVSEDTRSCSR